MVATLKVPLLTLAGLLAFSPAHALDGEPYQKYLDRVKAKKIQGVVKGHAVGATAFRGKNKVDLLPQFPGASRQQCDVGSCHAFSSVAILEAAIFRAHGRKVRLSEADLYFRRTVLSGDIYQAFCDSGECTFTEGNDAYGDIKYAIEHGVATSVQYRQFVQRYRRYRAAEKKTMKGLQKQWEAMGWLEKLLYDPRSHWRELQQRPLARRLLARFLQGSDSVIDRERAETKKLMKGFRVVRKQFDYHGAQANDISKADCETQGTDQGKLLRDELTAKPAGRPVSVSMSLSGLAAWGQTDNSKHANHAFMIVGYDAGGEKVAYKTRNSWGAGENHDVSPDELCRVYRVVTVLSPAEAAAED